MKLRISSLTILCLALAAVPVFADYSNGPINGTVDAWTINFGYVVSDTFTCCGLLSPYGFAFGVWQFPGDTLTQVDWSITSGENGGTVYAHGTASAFGGTGGTLNEQFISSNQYGYDIDNATVSGLHTSVPSGTLWLNLQNALVPSGDPVYWDENNGPSSASESTVGTIPSEAFTIYDTETTGTPEISSILLFGTGILGLVGVLRRKLL
jgi:hypothetical protein